MKEEFANIIIDIAHEKVDRPFTYAIPDFLSDEVQIGSTVCIPFGKGNQTRTGFVIDKVTKINIPREKIKDIIEVSTENVIVESKLIALAAWMRKKYGSTMTQALKTVLPVKSKVKPVEKFTVELILSEEEAVDFLAECERKHFTAKARLVKQLIADKKVPKLWITKILNISAATIKSLEGQGVIRITSEQSYRNPFANSNVEFLKKDLTDEQEAVTNEILRLSKEEKQYLHMIKGVTGSGKTEVYIELIARTIAEGKQAIVLIPEIALTYQTVRRFRERFGDRVTIMNSKLSPGERFDQMERAKNGQVDVMIGPRSALFTPFSKLGIIVIDEEHEASYKSENIPRYHAREVAKQIVKQEQALLVLGSATPSIETYYAYHKGEIAGHFLNGRYMERSLPTVYVKDLREELKNGNRSIFSETLQAKIEDRLEKKQQIMLFINRRGYAGFVSCRACGHVMKCPHCDVSLSEHVGDKLKCHYCGYETGSVKTCPECGSSYISGFRAGTQQIVDKLQIMYPKARILRMDADTTKRKDAYEKILSTFSNEEADILVGTQMIVKGHDFPKVTLVGILAADLSLSLSDFRAGEKTFQLLTQAAGRAGRGETKGEVVIQTYQPEHYSIIHAAAQDYEKFYDEELIYRTLCTYPPVGHLLSVQIMSKYEKNADQMANYLSASVKDFCKEHRILILGPSIARVGKIKDYYRYGFYLKTKDEEAILECKERIEEIYNNKMDQRCLLQFDFDPIQMF
jgi:primosomal protein N' (replication factor Y)